MKWARKVVCPCAEIEIRPTFWCAPCFLQPRCGCEKQCHHICMPPWIRIRFTVWNAHFLTESVYFLWSQTRKHTNGRDVCLYVPCGNGKLCKIECYTGWMNKIHAYQNLPDNLPSKIFFATPVGVKLICSFPPFLLTYSMYQPTNTNVCSCTLDEITRDGTVHCVWFVDCRAVDISFYVV